MPSPSQIYESVVRALEAETDTDPNPDSPLGPDARLSAIATINPDIRDSGGYNRSHSLPGIDVTLDRDERLDDGGPTGVWTGEWAYDDGHPTGRIFRKDWRTTIEFVTVMWSSDTDHDITDLNDDLGSVLDRFDTQLRADVLRDADGNPFPAGTIDSVTDEGGEMGRGSSSVREYERRLTVEHSERIDEAAEYGPTPTVRNVLSPLPQEHHGDPGTPGEIEGDVSQERIDAAGSSGE